MMSPILHLLDMLLLNTSWKRTLMSSSSYASRRTVRFLSLSSDHSPGHISATPPHITSTQSSTVKRIQALLTRRKKRYQDQQVVLEGPRMILDLFHSQPHLLQQVVLEESLYTTYAPQFSQIVPMVTASRNVLEACTDTVTNQGILAICDMPSSSRKKDSPSLSLILDGVSDPGNFGTLIRSAVASGVQSVYCLPNCCDPWNPKAIRSAAGATFAVKDLQSFKSWKELRTTLQEEEAGAETTIYAATMWEDRPSLPYYSVSYENCAVIIGNEGQGLSDAVRADPAVQAVHVPMRPGTIESLNAGVCGSILLFEAQRQREMGFGVN